MKKKDNRSAESECGARVGEAAAKKKQMGKKSAGGRQRC